MKIRQSYILAPYSQQLPLMVDVIRKHQAAQENGGKVIVFFPTANLVQYMSQVFNRLPQMEVMEIHSRLTQQGRVRVSDKFRKAQSAILFTSDVSARGVDYPGVSLVLQLGVADSKDQYIHRSTSIFV
jgi:ATP-dependent RNA helicase MSS116